MPDFLIYLLDITHIVNCTQSPNNFPLQFKYFNVGSRGYSHDTFTSVIDFIGNCIRVGGKVLICGERGIANSSSIVLCFLMHAKQFSLYEAMIFLREKRYLVNPDQHAVYQLQMWESNLLKGRKRTQSFSLCLCGACVVHMLASPAITVHPCCCHVRNLNYL